jgi:hypothetical protein
VGGAAAPGPLRRRLPGLPGGGSSLGAAHAERREGPAAGALTGRGSSGLKALGGSRSRYSRSHHCWQQEHPDRRDPGQRGQRQAGRPEDQHRPGPSPGGSDGQRSCSRSQQRDIPPRGRVALQARLIIGGSRSGGREPIGRSGKSIVLWLQSREAEGAGVVARYGRDGPGCCPLALSDGQQPAQSMRGSWTFRVTRPDSTVGTTTDRGPRRRLGGLSGRVAVEARP